MRRADAAYHHEKPLLDPDFFEVLLQALSALSSIATLAVVWQQIRDAKSQRRIRSDANSFRGLVRQIRRCHDDLFEEVDEIVRIFHLAEQRSKTPFTSAVMGFGSVRFDFTESELRSLDARLQNVTTNYGLIAGGCITLQLLLLRMEIPGEDGIRDNLGDLKERLNRILFASKNVGEATEELRQLKDRTRRFLDSLHTLTN